MADNGTYWWYSDSHAKLTHFFRCRTSLRADSYHTEVVDVQQNCVKTNFFGQKTAILEKVMLFLHVLYKELFCWRAWKKQ